MIAAFAVTVGPAAQVHFASNLNKACILLQDGVKKAFRVARKTNSRYCSLPVGCEESFDMNSELMTRQLDSELVDALKTMHEVQEKAQINASSRARVARVTGTPCPLAHFDGSGILGYTL